MCAWLAVLALWGCGDCGLDGWFCNIVERRSEVFGFLDGYM